MATSTLQIRVDSNLRKEADELFALAGLDMSSAVRLFLRQSVIRRRLPFEVVTENSDPFWSEANQRVLRESIESFERGEAKRHELIEAGRRQQGRGHQRPRSRQPRHHQALGRTHRDGHSHHSH